MDSSSLAVASFHETSSRSGTMYMSYGMVIDSFSPLSNLEVLMCQYNLQYENYNFGKTSQVSLKLVKLTWYKTITCFLF